MSQKITVDDLHTIAKVYFNESVEERVNSCSRMSQVVKLELQDEYDISATPYVVELSNESGSETHRVLEVSASRIGGITDQGTVYIDPSIHQFCESNYEKGLVALYFEQENLPETDEMGIITESHPIRPHIEAIASV